MTVPDAPLFTEPVVGFRQWLLIDGCLCPLFTCTLSAPWVPGINEARCYAAASRHNPHRAAPHGHSPVTHCSCGIYARHEITTTMRRDHIKGRVTGAIAAWGDLEVHRDGFRAQYAMVTAIAESASTPIPSEVAARYRVPLVPLELLELEGGRHGAPLPAFARPDVTDEGGGPRRRELD